MIDANGPPVVEPAAGATICLFARPVVPGDVKTRLIPALGAAGAARLYAAFLQDTLAHCLDTGARVVPWIAGDPEHPSLARLPRPRLRQPDGDLGTRMATALGHGAAGPGAGPGGAGTGAPVICIGTDAPSMTSDTLVAAFEALRRSDLVLCPAADGGYTLIGGRARGPLPDLAHGIRYSTRHALVDTLAAAGRAGLSAALLPPCYDVDGPADLRLLSLELSLRPGVAPATARAI